MLRSTNSSNNREFDSLLDKVERLSNGLERVGSDINEQEARLDAFLKRVDQIIYPSHHMESSPEKGERNKTRQLKSKISRRSSHDGILGYSKDTWRNLPDCG